MDDNLVFLDSQSFSNHKLATDRLHVYILTLFTFNAVKQKDLLWCKKTMFIIPKVVYQGKEIYIYVSGYQEWNFSHWPIRCPCKDHHFLSNYLIVKPIWIAQSFIFLALNIVHVDIFFTDLLRFFVTYLCLWRVLGGHIHVHLAVLVSGNSEWGMGF